MNFSRSITVLKSLANVSALVCASAASAQSSVAVFGVVDVGLSVGTGSFSDRTRLAAGNNLSSRLGFRGTEDLGGGLYANFWLEAALNNDDGTSAATNTNNQASGAGAALAGGQGLTFSRRSTVGLGGHWGEVRLGREFVPQYLSLTGFDPYGAVGAGASLTNAIAITGVVRARASNGITYVLPRNLAGFYGQFVYYLGENPSGTPTEDDGTGKGLRVGYAAGPLNVAFAMGRTHYAAGTIKQDNLAASYDVGRTKLIAQISRDANGAVKASGYLLAAVMIVGSGEVKLGYSQYETNAAGNPEARKLALGYVHNLSKRTALYATAARVRNSGGASFALNQATTAPNASSSGVDLGIRHSF